MKRYLCILSFLFFYVATYADNILESGADRLVEAIYTGASDFISYDANGNMIMDLNKGIERVTYDHNNLPKEILLKSRKSCRYTYDSSGRKLRAEYRTPRDMILKASSADDEARVGGVGRYVVTTIDYCGDNEYRNGALLRTHLPNGYIGNDSMYFYVNDCQGNVRCVVRQDGAVVESNEYYPYGGLFCAAPSVQPYKYGAKELDRMHGLDLYDSEARWYDPVLGRTTTMDPLAGKYPGLSPYLWCAANPMRFVDENGKEYGDTLRTQDSAAIDFGKCYNGISINDNSEYTTNIYTIVTPDGNIAYSYTKPMKGDANHGAIPLIPPNGENIVARAHTHAAYLINYGYGNNMFSGETGTADGNKHSSEGDIFLYNLHEVDGYVATPNGSLRKYDHRTGIAEIICDQMPSDIMDITRLNSVSSYSSEINRLIKNKY